MKRSLFFVLLLSINFAGNSQDIVAITRDLISKFNSGDSATYESWVAKWHRGSSQKMLAEYNHLGAVRIERIKQVSSFEAEALVQTLKYEGWWRIVVITDSMHQYKEHHMGIVRVTDEVLKSDPVSITKGIDEYIQRQAKYEEFKGNVLITKGNETVYSRSFGNGLDGKPNTISKQFDLASVGKLFTTIAIMQLIDQQKLSMQDNIGKLLPELQNKKLAVITIHQLLTHTSGMGDFFEDPEFKFMPGSPSPKHYISYFEKDSLRFSPGTNWSYSNTGFELLGYIIEKVSGIAYGDYINQHVFAKAGMKHSVVASGAGGGKSTAGDMQLFSSALLSKKLMSDSLTHSLLTYKENPFYGYGTEHTVLGNEHIVGHSGGFENVCNELNIYPVLGYTVIILSNGNPPFGHFLSDKIKELIVKN